MSVGSNSIASLPHKNARHEILLVGERFFGLCRAYETTVCALQDHALSWAGRGGPAFSSAGGSSGVAVAAFFGAVFADGFWVCGGPSVGTQCGVVR